VITLDHVERAFYTGWPGTLRAAEQDRAAILDMLTTANFVAPQELRNDAATRDALAARLEALADAAVPGDLVVVYFSGHGATLPDLNHDELGALRDGAWCLYDGMFVDDEITAALTKFKEGVRVVLISDSCFTGTIVARSLLEAQRDRRSIVIDPRGSKLAPVDIGERVYEAQKDYYDPILNLLPVDPDSAAASVLILSACAKDELSRIGEDGSVFSQSIVRVWDRGRFKGTFADLFDAVSAEVKKAVEVGQNPQKRLTGRETKPTLENQRAFGVASVNDRTKPLEVVLELKKAVEPGKSRSAPPKKERDQRGKRRPKGKGSRSAKRDGSYRDSDLRT
jgi:hypothetical protein